MVSFIIYVVGENSWEPVAWRIKSTFLCKSKQGSTFLCISKKGPYFVLIFPSHHLTTPVFPPPVLFLSHISCTDIRLLACMCSFFWWGQPLCSFGETVSLLESTGLGWGWPQLQPSIWVAVSRPGWWKHRIGDGKVPLAISIRTNLWFCRNYWKPGTELVGRVSGASRVM